MRRLLVLAVILGFGYLAYRITPGEMRGRALASTGLPHFFSETAPRYLRQKLSIPQSPVAKRRQLIEELAGTVANIVETLDAAVPPGAPAARPLPPSVRQGVERARELAVESEVKVRALEAVHADVGLLQGVAERALNRVLPLAENACIQPPQ